ncbi:serine hydrolase domain-containing protein [Aquipuribacter sp. MA13-6]|uniref:serine hydrolase domain-containing protein n=1 Tax=unclassified Aquipuribacter TaxID=2635084 RepID=UPI003EEBB33A
MPGRGQIPERLDERLSRLLARAVERRRHVRHGLLAVARVDGAWEWHGSHGVADAAGSPATTTVRYPIASITKLFTATVTLRLVEQGALSLGDRMVDLLPPDVTRGLHVRDGVDRTDEITVEHLLGHTSGLPDYYEEAPRGGRSAQARLLAGEDAPMPFEEVVRFVRDELTPHFPPQPLSSARPRAHYADTNYQLLGAVVEQVAGERLHLVVERALFAPLGLDDTSSYPHAPRSGRPPGPGTDVWARDVVLQPDGALRHQVPDGGIVSTVRDQVRFMTALVTGQVFEDPGTWPRMQRRLARVFFPIDYGLGVMRYAPPRWMSPVFAVPPVVGHTGSTATWLFHCPQLGVVTAGTFDVAQPALPFRFLPHVLRAVSTLDPSGGP